MDSDREKAIQEIHAEIINIKSKLESIRDEEEKWLENVPDSLKSSDEATISEEAIMSMNLAIESLEDALGPLDLENSTDQGKVDPSI